MMFSRLQSDGLRPREARPKAFLLENGGGDWGKALGGKIRQDLLGTTEAYNPEVTIATLCNKIIACRRRLLFPLLHAEKGRMRNAVANRGPVPEQQRK